jgi:hypothetical protein
VGAILISVSSPLAKPFMVRYSFPVGSPLVPVLQAAVSMASAAIPADTMLRARKNAGLKALIMVLLLTLYKSPPFKAFRATPGRLAHLSLTWGCSVTE